MAPVEDKVKKDSAKSSKDKESSSTDKDELKKSSSSKDNKDNKGGEEELSEEDQHLKEELEMLVERLTEPKVELYAKSLENLETFIKESTSSMTAVPKPLKFLRPFYPTLVKLYENPQWANNDTDLKIKLADILSVLGMTYSDEDGTDYVRECLKYRLKSYINESIGNWGHEYLRHLALEIGEEYQEILAFSNSVKEAEAEAEENDEDPTVSVVTTSNNNEEKTDDKKEDSIKDDINDIDSIAKRDAKLKENEIIKSSLIKLSLEIVPHFLKNNTEAEAIDLLLEIEEIEKLPQFIDKNTYSRVCNYMVSCVPLLAPPDDLAFLNTAFTIYLSNDQLPQALTLAIKLGDENLIKSVFDATNDELTHKQLGFILGRQNSCFKVENESVQECISNTKISEYFKYLIGELNLSQPKVPEDVYKSHLDSASNGGLGLSSGSKLESAGQNLASAFVSSFLNCGFGSEKLISDEKWIYKTKNEGMLSTTASLGLVHLWDTQEGLQILNEYLYSDQNKVKAGALLGMGISSTSVHDEVDATLLLLQDYINGETKDQDILKAAINGIGIAFAGSENEDVLNLLLPLVSDSSYSIDVQCLAGLALGHVFVGTCNGDITSSILQSLLEKEFNDLTNKWIRFISLGLGLLYMGKYEQVDDVLETIDAIEHPISKGLKVLVNICSYAGTGNVLQIQSLLELCTIKPKEEKDEDEDEEETTATTTTAAATTTTTTTTTAAAAAAADQATTTETTTTTTEKKESSNEEGEEDKDKSDEDEDEDEAYQGYAVLGLALIAMGEEVGQEMSLRHFRHLMHYGNPLIKRAVPLAMGLVSCSSASMNVYETLSRYSHDNDLDVSMNSIFGMGLCGAGTNNARLAQLLRQLASYYGNEQRALFMTRISQGLVHLGKGTLSLNPFNTDHLVLSKVSLASLLTVCVTLLDPTSFILGSDMYKLATDSNLLYYVTPAIHPRMLITVDENLEPIKVNVRVGQVVDTVGQAGKPKTITGWVTHLTPVLLGHGERAELENDEYISLSSSLEGIVILKKNPDYMEVE